MRVAHGLAAFVCVALVALHPRAGIAALVVCAALGLVVRREVALGLCLVLLVGAAFGLRVDAAPPSGPPAGARR